MRYKAFFHRGDELTLKTRVQKGHAWVDDVGLHLESDGESQAFPKARLQSVERFKLHGIGSVLRIETSEGRLFVSVVRFMIGQYALINFHGTKALQAKLAAPIVNR